MCLSGSAAAEGTVSARLRSQVLADRTEVEFGDVAELSGDTVDRAGVEHVVVCRAPRVGYVERVSREMVEAALRRAGRRTVIEWEDGGVAQVRSASRSIPGSDVADAVRQALHVVDEGNVLNFTVARAIGDVDVPARAATLRVRPIDRASVKQRMSVWVDVVVDGAVYRSVQVPVEVAHEERVLVARTDLPAGVAGIGAFDAADRNVVGLRYVRPDSHLANAQVRLVRPLRAGEMLTTDKIADTDELAPGERVHVVARAGGAGVEMDGVVVRGGRNGQLVEVRVAHSAQPISATVLDRHTVEVQ
jgi:flagella basal body P-ring formation protein FlgA